MQKYAGVVLDHLDDNFALVKETWPTPEQLPGHVKTGAYHLVQEAEPDQFALSVRDGDYLMQKWACFDAGTTTISSMYFVKNAHKLSPELQKLAATNLVIACQKHGLTPPGALLKLAGDMQVGEVDYHTPVAGPEPKVASHRPDNQELYALEVDGRHMYPIDTFQNIKLAEAYWLENQRQMHPAMRRQFAVKLASRADDLALELDEAIKTAGSTTWGSSERTEEALLLRKQATIDEGLHQQLARLNHVAGLFDPEKFASWLHDFDTTHGLDRLWDSKIPDPWSSTFGLQKEAELVFHDAANTMATAEDIHNLVEQRSGDLDELFTDGVAAGAEKDPVGWFKSLPENIKPRVARLARDYSSRGGGVTQIPPKTGPDQQKMSSAEMFSLALAKIRQAR